MKRIPHPIPYQGSKRNLAEQILGYLPDNTQRLIEPFAGSAALSIAAIYHRRVQALWLNDKNAALVSLWHEIIYQPQRLAKQYESLWHAQANRERRFYDLVRQRFNATQRPAYFLYLLARCVKASVRYNAQGEFNQSPDNRRKGRNPKTMQHDIEGASALLHDRMRVLTAYNYKRVLLEATPYDVIYLDPPYQGVSRTRDPRYMSGVLRDEFVSALADLNARHIPYLLSYDGRTGIKSYGDGLPDELQLKRIELDAGRSSQATLLGRSERTYEALYLSPALLATLETTHEPNQMRNQPVQLPLFAEPV